MIGWLPRGNDAFDARFYVFELATMGFWFLAMLTFRWQRRVRGLLRVVALGVAMFSGLLVPAIWILGFPPDGFEEPLRVITGAPLTLGNCLLSYIWAVATSADAIVPRGPAVRPFVAIGALNLFGCLFLVLDVFWHG